MFICFFLDYFIKLLHAMCCCDSSTLAAGLFRVFPSLSHKTFEVHELIVPSVSLLDGSNLRNQSPLQNALRLFDVD